MTIKYLLINQSMVKMNQNKSKDIVKKNGCIILKFIGLEAFTLLHKVTTYFWLW